MASTIRQTRAVKSELERDIAELEHVRDEIRLKLHLCGMDLRSSWRKLDKRLELLEERFGREGDHVAETTRQLAKELKTSFRELKERVL
jgi:chromosome segregation ATPase